MFRCKTHKIRNGWRNISGASKITASFWCSPETPVKCWHLYKSRTVCCLAWQVLCHNTKWCDSITTCQILTVIELYSVDQKKHHSISWYGRSRASKLGDQCWTVLCRKYNTVYGIFIGKKNIPYRYIIYAFIDNCWLISYNISQKRAISTYSCFFKSLI